MLTKNIINNSKNIFLIRIDYIIFIINCIFLTISNNVFLFNNNYISEIKLKIKGNGTQKIFYKKNAESPNQIYLNRNLTDSKLKDKYITININGNADQENNISLIWNNFRGHLMYLFRSLTNIIEADLSKLNASIIEMQSTFNGCSSLKFANLSNLDISQVTNMGHLFAYCISLTSVDLSNLDTSKVNFMDNMFLNCFSLSTLNLSNFDTSKVSNIENMFKNCKSLISLNLSNFNLPLIKDISDMFINCNNLVYLNIKNMDIPLNQLQTIIKNISINTVLCINKI